MCSGQLINRVLDHSFPHLPIFFYYTAGCAISHWVYKFNLGHCEVSVKPTHPLVRAVAKGLEYLAGNGPGMI